MNPSGLSDHCPVLSPVVLHLPFANPPPSKHPAEPLCTSHAAAVSTLDMIPATAAATRAPSPALPTSEHHQLVQPPLPAAPPKSCHERPSIQSSHHPSPHITPPAAWHTCSLWASSYACAWRSPPAPHASLRHHPLTAYSGPSLSPPTIQYHPLCFQHRVACNPPPSPHLHTLASPITPAVKPAHIYTT